MYGHQFLLPIPDIDRTRLLPDARREPGRVERQPDDRARRREAAARRSPRAAGSWCVDPRRTETAAIASEHHFIRPGTDALFLVGAAAGAAARSGAPRLERYGGRLSRARRRRSHAIARLRRRDAIARARGIDAATTSRASRASCAPRRAPSSTAAWACRRSRSARSCQWLIQLLNLVTGNLDREGGVLPNEPAIPLTGPGHVAGHARPLAQPRARPAGVRRRAAGRGAGRGNRDAGRRARCARC